MKKISLKQILFICLLFVSLVGEVRTAWAATDKKAPTITYSCSTKEATDHAIKIKIRVKDSSKITAVKWASGSHKASYFAKKGEKLTLKKSVAYVKVKENGIYTFYAKDSAGNTSVKKVSVKNIDTEEPVLSASYHVMEQKATVSVNGKDEASGIQYVKYHKGNLSADAKEWEEDTAVLVENEQFIVSENGIYTILAEDAAGNRTVFPLEIQIEFRAVWISYLEFSKDGYTEESFQAHIDEMYDNCVKNHMNAVIVQVRPMSDALYPSKYFPWSVYASGEQGKDPGYDPLEYMVEAAHERGLAFHAWINPYRITLTGTKTSALSEDNPARMWREEKSTKRNVLTHDGKLFYNPSSEQAQKLIVNGVKEIVENYDVDGIHFDDYFYPGLGSSYKSNFDAAEYKEYKKECEEEGTTPESIVDWRRSNVNTLVKNIYAAIKEIKEDCVFGISPAGNMSNLYLPNNYYSDVKLWMSSSEYIDYICPQIYWSFKHKTAAYDKMLKEWMDAKTSDTVNLYVGLAAYRAGISKTEASSIGDSEWATSKTVLKRQVLEGRESGIVDGFVLFRYDFTVGKKAEKEMKNLVSILD